MIKKRSFAIKKRLLQNEASQNIIRMKRILFYTDTPLLGGAENQMLLLAKFLPKEKYAVALACSNLKNLNPWCQDFMEAGVPVFRAAVLHKHDPRHYVFLKKILPRFDLLHLHIWNPASCRYAFLAAAKTPIVVTEHDPFPLKGLKSWLKKQFYKKVLRIIATSNAAKKLALEQNAEWEPKISLVPNGIDIEQWKNESIVENRNLFRHEHFNALPGEKIILSVAELHERKGQKHLIAAMKTVLSDFPNVKLALVGEGKCRKFYEKIASELNGRIIFLGRRREIPKLMAAADIFVLPSEREAFGLVLLEAAVSGLPVVAANVGGIAEIVENNKTGILVEPKNPAALADAIKEILANPAKALELVKNAKEKTEIHFSAKTMAQKTAEVYEEVFAAQNP